AAGRCSVCSCPGSKQLSPTRMRGDSKSVALPILSGRKTAWSAGRIADGCSIGGGPPRGQSRGYARGMPKSLADLVREALAEVREVAPDEVRVLLDRPDRDGFWLVDVREPDEFAEGHLPGARLYPRGFLEGRAELEHRKRDAWLSAARSRPLILYCGGGHRSALAAQSLQRMGFTNVASMAEGWTRWAERRSPVEK